MFAGFCVAAFALAFILWAGAALLKLSWVMLKGIFLAEVGLPGFGDTTGMSRL